MQYLLHIGTNKTGTSSLQRIFFDNRALLSEYGIAYPTVGIETAAHHNVSRALKGVQLDELGMSENWIEELHAECQGHDICLLSSENFHTIQHPSNVLPLCPRGRTKVIVYIREHAVYLTSWYQQAIQSRNTSMTLDEFIDHHPANHMTMINGWVEAYGQENVIVRHYERDALKERDIVADFLQFLDPEISRHLAKVKIASNPSVSGNLLFFKRVLNVFLSKEESLSIANEFSDMVDLDPTFGGRIAVQQNQIDRIKFQYRNDRRDLNSLYNFNIRAIDKPIKGSLCPDYDRLERDMEKIMDYSINMDFKLLRFVDRMNMLWTYRFPSNA